MRGSVLPFLVGVSKGGKAHIWHTTLLAKCSVLYLSARLTGETGGGAFCAPFAPAGKQAEILRMAISKKSGCFQKAAAGIWKPPSLVLRSRLWPHSRKNGNGREAILWLSRLDYPSARTGGAVNGGA